jgi:para-nitrobenzyl esterase
MSNLPRPVLYFAALALITVIVLLAPTVPTSNSASAASDSPVRINSGLIQGTTSTDGLIRIFKGIPYAAPPVGPLRWTEPRPTAPWQGVKKTADFGPRCMQAPLFSDMVFRDPGPSEDCLYLNVWTPATRPADKLPIMVWIYGGGFQGGATSEPRQDGENLARKGVIVVSMNYRLGIFGFFSHPQLTDESPHHASGNYGLLDQAAALQWVHDNIAAFGGNPNNITIFGESAGSFSVSALMASPLTKNLIHAAIGESGAFFGRSLHAESLEQNQKRNAIFAEQLGLPSIARLRAVDAHQLLDAAVKIKELTHFGPNIDGYFMPATAYQIYSHGQQAHVPLLAGWNHDEGNYHEFFEKESPTKENYESDLRRRFGDAAPEALKLFPDATDQELKSSAGLLSTADFIAYSTWKWITLHTQTGESPVYRYEFDQQPPPSDFHDQLPEPEAYHSAEIEYVFGTLDWKKIPWTPADRKLSALMQTYWTNFAKAGTPNDRSTPRWLPNKITAPQVMHLSANPQCTTPDPQQPQFQFLDQTNPNPH